MTDLRERIARGEIRAGAVLEVSRAFERRDVDAFGDLTRDYNPVHYVQAWCDAKGYREPIAHGLLTGSMLCELGGQLGWLATSMSFRFRRPVYVGDRITCRLTIDALDERGAARGSCVFTNQAGETVLTAELGGYLPAPSERALLGEMIAAGDPTNPL